MEKRGYINLVVLDQSPGAETLQQAWQAYAAAHLHDANDNAGRCAPFQLTLEGTDHAFLAVLGTTWNTNDLYDTALGMAQEMHRHFGANTPPLLVTVHYNDSPNVHIKTFWSENEYEHDWWDIALHSPPKSFGYQPPQFLAAELINALNSDLDGAMHFRTRIREQQLNEHLPSPHPSPRTPRF